MHITPAILLGLGLALGACVFTQLPDRTRQKWSECVNWWHALVGVIAVVLAFVILLNPEFLALGFLGDTAFFDLLVLLIGLQLRTVAAQAWRGIVWVFARILCWPSLSYLLVLSMFTVLADMFSTIQKFVHRISS
jgi:hypothetical protein